MSATATKMCRTCYAKIPARSRGGSYVQFQLRPTHLVTESDNYQIRDNTPDQIRGAALTVADRVPRDGVLEVLDMLGLVSNLLEPTPS